MTQIEKFFSQEVADAIGIGAALQAADLAQKMHETMDRANARLIAAGRPTLQEQWVKVEQRIASSKVDRERRLHGPPC
ncbi:hypothetical protein [Cupriavidus sp. D39]|uniref:hypothetical protein n=1 Tax=Cupriavidus sp. D39 TaxID=2997877 RepID=UPI00226D8067|nr:hypothetical protein [Cupriavidus sp. D39]MCY0852762.1 hypothetical protein [Cupriavidus sp. D39]